MQVKRQVRSFTRSATPVTFALMAVNIAVFVLGQAKLTLFTNDKLALYSLNATSFQRAAGVANGDWWRIVTSGFAHAGLLHIAFNMYALYALGQAMERQLGSARFLGVYGVALLGGSLGVIVLQPLAASVGASGAVFGLFGAMAVAMRQRGISVLRSPLGPTLVINFVLTFSIPSISVGGHIGGFLLGGVAGGLLLNPRRQSRDDRRDAAMLLGLAVVVFVLCLVVAQHPFNGGRGLWPRGTA